MSGEWGPWVDHDGKGIPVQSGEVVWAVEADGSEFSGMILVSANRAGEVDVWDWDDCARQNVWHYRVIRYRKLKPMGLRLLEGIAADPAPLPDLVSSDA